MPEYKRLVAGETEFWGGSFLQVSHWKPIRLHNADLRVQSIVAAFPTVTPKLQPNGGVKRGGGFATNRRLFVFGNALTAVHFMTRQNLTCTAWRSS